MREMQSYILDLHSKINPPLNRNQCTLRKSMTYRYSRNERTSHACRKAKPGNSSFETIWKQKEEKIISYKFLLDYDRALISAKN